MYGFWLPNDPRGSWSDFVGSWELLRYGRATTVNVRRSLANELCDHYQRKKAKQKLKYPAVRVSGLQAKAIGLGFSDHVSKGRTQVCACAILPEHIHLVIARRDISVERVVNNLKGSATIRLNADCIHPQIKHQGTMRRPPRAFSRGCWKVYLNNTSDVERAIKYVQDNPPKEGKPSQKWSFVSRYVE